MIIIDESVFPHPEYLVTEEEFGPECLHTEYLGI